MSTLWIGRLCRETGIHCQEKTQMVLKSSSAQMTSPEQPASTGRREKFSSGQSGPGLSSLYLVTGWGPLPSLSSSCPLPLSPPSHPGCLGDAQNARAVVRSSSDCLASREAGMATSWEPSSHSYSGPGPRDSFNLIKLGRNEVCMN